MLTAAAAPAEKLVATAHDAFLRAVDLGSTTAEGRELPPGTIAGACSSEGLIHPAHSGVTPVPFDLN